MVTDVAEKVKPKNQKADDAPVVKKPVVPIKVVLVESF
jgi:hypothetical protein